MAKDTFYFTHDFNTRNDEKIKLLIRKHRMQGYGIFWAIIEDLYNNANVMRLDYEGIADDLRVDTDIIKSIINDFNLFIIDGNNFGSLSVERRLNERKEKSKNASDSANKRWEIYRNYLDNNANAMQTHSERNANVMRTQCETDATAMLERKGKEIKEINKENIIVAKATSTKKSFEERRKDFAIQVQSFKDKYEKDLLAKFFSYWVEPNKPKTKMKFELEKTWDLSMRIARWKANDFKKKITEIPIYVPEFVM